MLVAVLTKDFVSLLDYLVRKRGISFRSEIGLNIQDCYFYFLSVQVTLVVSLSAGLTAFANEMASNKNIREILKRHRPFEEVSLHQATLQKEQERKLSPEIEQERELQRCAPMEAEKHELQPDLVQLVNTSIFLARSDAFVPAFQVLKPTGAAM